MSGITGKFGKSFRVHHVHVIEASSAGTLTEEGLQFLWGHYPRAKDGHHQDNVGPHFNYRGATVHDVELIDQRHRRAPSLRGGALKFGQWRRL